MDENKDSLFDGQLERLKMLYRVVSDTDLALKMRKTQSAISSAKMRGRVPSVWMMDAAYSFGVNLQWIITGEGEQFLPYQAGAETKKPDVEVLMVPLVEAVLSAGHGRFESEPGSGRGYVFRSDFLHGKGVPARMVLMRVDGDSMEPDIKSGDMVLIDQSQTTLYPGQFYAVAVENMVFVKIVSAMPGKVLLRSLNTAYPPVEIDTRGDLEDMVRIIGRCVWICRELL